MVEHWLPCLLLFAILRFAFCCSSTRVDPPPDRNGPNLECPPPKVVENDPFQNHAVVFYSGPNTARDPEDNQDHSVTRTGLASGSAFPEGTTKIYFSASDFAGNPSKCSLDITVQVVRCKAPEAIQNGFLHCHPRDDFVKGAVCNFGCYEGYKLSGLSSRITCMSTGRWSYFQPTCQRVECPLLDPPPMGSYSCTDGRYFLSACSLRCPPGFSVPPGNPSVQVCGKDGHWRGSSSDCKDSEPPKLEGCGSYFEVVAGKGRAGAEVNWTQPTVSDNYEKNIVPKILGDLRPGMFKHAGTYRVGFTARDSAGNEALPCEITVVVKVLMCPIQYPTPNLLTSCRYGVSYGAVCEHSCQGGWKLVGTPKSFCERSSTSPVYALWDYRDGQPKCQKGRQCPDLPAPVNGALACDLWYGGEFCQMQCRSGTDFPDNQALLKEINVCGSDTAWSYPVPSEPECLDVKPPKGVQTAGKFSFFAESCFTEEARQQIRQNFINKFSTSLFKAACSVPQCTVDMVEVKCGQTRQKRSTNSTFDTNSTAEITIGFLLRTALGTSGEKETDYQKAVTSANAILKNMTPESDLDPFLSEVVGGNISIRGATLQRGFPRPDCDPGSFASYSENACVECSKGSHYDQDKDSCVPCPVGTYQDMYGKTSCLSCPPHHSTLESGTSSSQACLPLCSPGHWSTTGMEPCSPCARGTLQSGHGAMSCLPCPGNTATLEEGATSPGACQDFDIAFPPAHTASTELEFAVTEMAEENLILTFNFWLQGASDTEVVFFNFSLGQDNLALFLTPAANLKLTLNGEDIADDVGCNASRWRNVHLVLNGSDVTLHVDGQPDLQSVTGLQWGQRTMLSNATEARLELGGEGFVGAITQLHIWSSEVKPPDVTSMTQCSQPFLGNLLSWRHLLNATEKGSYVRLPSQCDAVDACLSNPCVNGTCTDTMDGFTCTCNEAFTGSLCDVNIDDCEGHLCVNGGSCEDGVNAYTCSCLSNYTGAFCDDVIRDGGWGDWGNWSQCSVTCGEGVWQRQRRCDSPLPQNGGLACPGEVTETAACNLAVCPECPRVTAPANGSWMCEINVTLTRCHVGCDAGFDFDIEPLPEYWCGLQTGYNWTFQTQSNPQRRLPNCMPKAAPDSANVSWQADYSNLTCGDAGTTEEVKKQVTIALDNVTNKIKCVQENTCKVEQRAVTKCEADRDRVKRSLQTAGLSITFSISPKKVGGNESLAAVKDALDSLNISARDGAFNVRLGSDVFTLSLNTTYVAALVDCAPGYAFIPYYCVPCGPGTYGLTDYCRLCDVGTYQSLLAQNSCLPCPQGWSTPGRGSRSSEECTVALPSSAATAVLNITLIIGATVGSILGLALMVLIVVVIIKKLSSHRTQVDPNEPKVYALPEFPEDCGVSNVKFKM